jgi:hypothetical protein
MFNSSEQNWPKVSLFRQQKKEPGKFFPGSFSRSVGTAKLKGLQVRFCLYLYFNLFNYSKVSLFFLLRRIPVAPGCAQGKWIIYCLDDVRIYYNKFIREMERARWNYQPAQISVFNLIVRKSKKTFPFSRSINKLPDNYIISFTCCLFDFLISRNNFIHLLPFYISSDETFSIFPCCLFSKEKRRANLLVFLPMRKLSLNAKVKT